MAENVAEWAIKIVFLGDGGVGKTSLINQYIDHSFSEDYIATIGVNITTKDITLDGTEGIIRLILWDIAGQDRYELSRSMFFQGAAGAFLVFDKTRDTTYNSIKPKWLKEFKQYGMDGAPFILVANKVDLMNSFKVGSDQGNKLAEETQAIDYLETSAKYGENVEIAFHNLVRRILEDFGVDI